MALKFQAEIPYMKLLLPLVRRVADDDWLTYYVVSYNRTKQTSYSVNYEKF